MIRSDPTTQPTDAVTNCTALSTGCRGDAPAPEAEAEAPPHDSLGAGLAEWSWGWPVGGADLLVGAAGPQPAARAVARTGARARISPASRPDGAPGPRPLRFMTLGCR